MSFSNQTLSRWGWFVIVGAFFGARDMCAGNGGPPPPDPTPADGGADEPKDAGGDAMSLRARPSLRALARLNERAPRATQARSRTPS